MVLPKFLGRRYISPEESCYRRLVTQGYRPGSIIDVGAYEGNWTRLARSVFPSLDILMVEAQPAKLPLLDRVCAELPGVRVVSAPLSSKSGEKISFFEMETGSSLLPEQSNIPRVERILTTKTLDEVAELVAGPIFLKIDVQGAELLVLEGGATTLCAVTAFSLKSQRCRTIEERRPSWRSSNTWTRTSSSRTTWQGGAGRTMFISFRSIFSSLGGSLRFVLRSLPSESLFV